MEELRGGSAPGCGSGFAAKLLLAELAKACLLLLLAPDAGFFVVLPAARFGKDPVLLDAFVEALEGYFKRLAFGNDDFGQERLSPRLLVGMLGRAEGARSLL